MSLKLVLVINSGSSSLKFAIIDAVSEKKYIYGLAECLNLTESRITWTIDQSTQYASLKSKSTHREALQFIIKNIFRKKQNIFKQISAIGHRIVHGGHNFTKSVILNKDIIKKIISCIPFAPLHNPANIIGIKETLIEFPELAKKNVAVFDTAFHQSMPKEAYIYALPYTLHKDYGIRRYGAHGISHFYVSCMTAKFLKKPINKLNIITCHLGNGSSITAIRNGKSIDTSMGLTPLEGLIMGTRCGDIDPAIIFYLYEELNLSIAEIKILLTKHSGLLGLTEVTNDCRYIEKNYYNQDQARLAINMFCHRLVKYIGAYSSLINDKLDALIFTGGIGENSSLIRSLSLKKLTFLGFECEDEKNNKTKCGISGIITTKKSRYPAIVIPTNEELVIAQETANLILS